MGFIKTHKTSISAAIILGTVYFVSRLLFLKNLPIFTDEAIYLRWAQIALNDHNWLFISLSDGKQPLFIWFISILMTIIKDPLIAGRLVSVFSGFFTMIGLYFLSKELFRNRNIGLFSAFLYIVYPFSLVYDRMAIYDSLVAAFWIWSSYIVLKFIKKPNLVNASILGFSVGLSNLNKSNFLLPTLLAPIILFISSWKGINSIKKMFIPFMLLLFSGVISFLIYSTLRISPLFYIIGQKNAVFIYPFSEWISHPLVSLTGNLNALGGWFISYASLPLIILFIICFFLDRKFIREKLILLIWFIVPFIILSLVGRVIYPRYILFMSISLLPLGAYSLEIIKNVFKNKYLFAFLLMLFCFVSLKADFYILTNFPKSSVPLTDKFQYSIGWPAGNGINESVNFFKEQSKKGPIFIGTGGTFGLMPMSYEIYLVTNPNVKIKGYWPIENAPPSDLLKLKEKQDVYFVFYQPCPSCKNIGDAPASWGLTKIVSYPKDGANLTIYKF